MDSVLEKITLYDILGYLLPGSVLMLLVLFGLEQGGMGGMPDQWGAEQGFAYFVFFLMSYVIGIVLSEVMTFVWKQTDKIVARILEYIKRQQDGFPLKKGILKRENNRAERKFMEQTAKALMKSGTQEDEATIKNAIQNGTFRDTYMRYMYSAIQTFDDCKRIHNYASAQVLYKNLTGALIIGSMFLWYGYGWCICLPGIMCIAISLVFIRRGVRFQEKKYEYTVMWFLEKFRSGQGR